MLSSDTSTWPLLYIPMEGYLGYRITLHHYQSDQYKVNISRPPSLHDWGYVDVVSDKTFPLEKTDEAIAHAQELIDQDVEPILPY